MSLFQAQQRRLLCQPTLTIEALSLLWLKPSNFAPWVPLYPTPGMC